MKGTGADWWRGGVIYQVYPRSFADSDGDGVGDLQGIIAHLDHLAWLGVDALWLNPIHPSPNADWGYDVADYYSVHPELGSLADLDRLVAEASARGLKVLLDLVPNHTSDRHPWFSEARGARGAPRRDWYVWADPGPGGAAPNNWLSAFGGPAWTLDGASGQFYLHNFLPEQPDLNWWNEKVRSEFDRILRFWFDRGVAGFRIDVAHALVKDAQLRDNLPVTDEDHPFTRRQGQRHVYSMNRPEVHEILKRWRALAEEYECPRVLVGETFVLDLSLLASYYGRGDDELNLAFNFPFMFAPFDPGLRAIVEEVESLMPKQALPVWTGSNHDMSRFPSRWAGGDQALTRLALLMLLTLRGSVCLYYGDELGMREVAVPYEALRDPVGLRRWPDDPGRDKARTPMLWSPAPGAGFTKKGVRPWLPFGVREVGDSVSEQAADPGSVLNLCRDLLRLRRAEPELRLGAYCALPSPPGTWVWARGDRFLVALNFSDEAASLPDLAGDVIISTDRIMDGRRVERLELPAKTGALLHAERGSEARDAPEGV